MTHMGDRIRELRIEHKMTQTDLGNVLGVGKSAILKYEKGEVENLPRTTIKKMANLFGVSPAYLMCFDNWDEEKLSDEVDLIERIQVKWGKDAVTILQIYTELNADGQHKLLSMSEDLSELPKYCTTGSR